MTDEGAGSRYIATVMHPDEATRERYVKMGFFDGWDTVITQLDDFASTLR